MARKTWLLLVAWLTACADADSSSLDDAAQTSAPASLTGALEIFMTVDGSDAADGSTVQTAVATLTRAHEIVAALPADIDRDVVVRIGSGTYRGHPTVLWTRVIPGHSITFEPLDPSGPMPEFDGTPAATHDWFVLDYAEGPSRLRFHGLAIHRYPVAISFAGGLDAAPPGNSENEIDGMLFYAIGGIQNNNYAQPALHFRKSSRNAIRHNRFIWFAPTPQPGTTGWPCSGLHVMYFSDRSSENDITHNRFEDVCAEPVIKFRNGSNDNVVAGNEFLHTGGNVVGTALVGNMNTVVAGECPPVGTRVFYNTYCGGFFDQHVGTFSDNTKGYPDDGQRIAVGLPACERETDARPAIRNYGNVDGKVTPTPWCQPLPLAQIQYRWSYWPFSVDGRTPF